MQRMPKRPRNSSKNNKSLPRPSTSPAPSPEKKNWPRNERLESKKLSVIRNWPPRSASRDDKLSLPGGTPDRTRSTS